MGAPEVTLGRLHGDVAEEELDLLQFAAGCATEPSATPPKIVRPKLAHTDFRRKLFDDVPNELLRHHFAPNRPSATHAAEEAATGDSSGLHPVIEETAHQVRDRDGSNVTTLPSQVHDCPMALTLLKVVDGQASEFMAPKSASQKNSK